MKRTKNAVSRLRLISFTIGLFLIQTYCYSQENILVNLSLLDGIELTPDNLFNYQVINNSGSSKEVLLKGTVRYRNSPLRFSYTFTTVINAGIHQLLKERVHPDWEFSEQGLRELFFNYKKLPQGTYEYCVELSFKNGSDLPGSMPADDCIYQKVDDIFLINLIEPEDGAELYEHYPMFNWVVNYPFASELSYRIRVAELKQGQSKENAITRNPPVYQDSRIFSTGTIYPLTARPLSVWQPYVWTVDAYYKGILLGGAEAWKFTIVEDSVYQAFPDESPYIDINIDDGSNRYYAVGNVKLRYSESDFLQNELEIKLLRKGKEIKNGRMIWPVNRGENFNTYDLTDLKLKHKEEFEVYIEFKKIKSNHNKQTIKFQYVNPNFVK